MGEATNTQAGVKKPKEPLNYAGDIGVSQKFASLSRLITRDMNNYNNRHLPRFQKYTKDDIMLYLSDPCKFQRELRGAVRYMYSASSHFRRLIQYFVSLSDLAYVIEPYKIDPRKANIKTVGNNYRKVLNTLSSMSIKTQFPKILTVCLREDVFFGTFRVADNDIVIQQLPSDWCAISCIEGKVANVTFNFSYFDTRQYLLEFYPEEFTVKYYDVYRKNTRDKWIELDCPNSFAVKCNNDTPDFPVPPFCGLLPEVYELEDYRSLKLTKTALENYAMVVMTIPLEDGEWGIDLEKARNFWKNLDSVLPEEVGSILTPMEISKISFEKSNTGDTDTIAEAEENLFTSAGVSSLLFNNEKASANALLLSIKADQAITYGIVKSIQDVVNRFIQYQSYGKNFKVNFLDVSPYNRSETGDAYLKAASYGLPTISMYAASQGLGQAELDSMSFLEGQVLGLQDIFRPIQSSSQMSSSDLDSEAATDEGGAPRKSIGELSDSRESNQERE